MHAARLAVLAAALLFSTGGTVIKATTWSGFAVAGGRSLVAALVLFLVMPRWRRFWEPRALAVGAAYGATLVLFVVANKLTTAANAIFLQASAPLYTLVLGPWLLGERNRPSDLAGTAVLAAGMLLFFVGVEPPGASAVNPALGNAVAAASGLTWAFTVVGLRGLSRASGPGASDPGGASVVAGNLLACAVCLPLALPLPEAPFATVARDLCWIAYLGTFQIGLAYLLLNRGIARLPALEVSLLLLLEPVLSALLAWQVHGEAPGPFALAGCALIAAATAVRIALAARSASAG